MARKAATLAFVALQALAALALFLFSVHGPRGLALSAPAYFIAAAALTWWAGRRSWHALWAAGLAMLAAAPGLYATLDLAGRRLDASRIAGTLVMDVYDTPILSAGRPVGVRLSYDVVVPATGHFAIFPTLRGSGAAEQLELQAKRWTFDGRPGPDVGPFRAGKRHEVSVELYPATVAFNAQGIACLQGGAPSPLPAAGQSAPLRIFIWDTPYGDPERGREERTKGAYVLPALYRNVVAEGWPPCKVRP
jgi:hypothetical protein